MQLLLAFSLAGGWGSWTLLPPVPLWVPTGSRAGSPCVCHSLPTHPLLRVSGCLCVAAADFFLLLHFATWEGWYTRNTLPFLFQIHSKDVCQSLRPPTPVFGPGELRTVQSAGLTKNPTQLSDFHSSLYRDINKSHSTTRNTSHLRRLQWSQDCMWEGINKTAINN